MLAKPTMKTWLNTSTGLAQAYLREFFSDIIVLYGVFDFRIEIHKAVFLERLLFCESNSKITFRISANAIGNIKERWLIDFFKRLNYKKDE